MKFIKLTALCFFVLFFLKVNSQSIAPPYIRCGYGSGCNYFNNSDLILNVPFYDPEEAFKDHKVTDWEQSHGSPGLYQFQASPQINFIYLAAFGGTGYGEGVATGIRNLTPGHRYALSFQRSVNSNPNTTPTSPTSLVHHFSVVLIHCADFTAFNKDVYNTPTVPAGAQIIHCESNLSTVGWQQVFECFTASSDYDVVWFYPQNDDATQSDIEVMQPELIDITSFDAGPDVCSPGANTIIGPSTSNCSVKNALFTWTGPNGQLISTSNNPPQTPINMQDPLNWGTWTLSMTVPGSIYSSCSGQCTIIDSIHAFNDRKGRPIVNWPDYICQLGSGVYVTSSIPAPYYEWQKRIGLVWTDLSAGYGPGYRSYFVSSAGTYRLIVGNGHTPGNCNYTSPQKTIGLKNCGPGPTHFIISPNPGHSMMNVRVDPNYASTTKIHAIKIIDRFDVVRMQYQYSGVQTSDLNITGLQTDVYTAQIYDGVQWTSMQFIKQ